MKVSKYAKAIVAAVVAGAGSLSTALADDTITTAEGWAAGVVALAALGFTWGVPNKPAQTEGSDA